MDGTQIVLQGRLPELRFLGSAKRHFGWKEAESSLPPAAGPTSQRGGAQGHRLGIEVFGALASAENSLLPAGAASTVQVRRGSPDGAR